MLMLLLAVTAASAARADKLPLWEVGAGVATLNLPQYPGSDQHISGVLPIPYFVYRGKRLKISRDVLSGRLFRSDNLTVEVSADYGLPVKSRDSHAREGMPDIDFLLEIGPSLKWDFHHDASRRRKWSLELPLRAVLESDFTYVRDAGWRFNPKLRFQEYFGPWYLSVWLGAYLNDSRYDRLLYGVAPRYATPERPAYDAGSGYGGVVFSTSLSYRLGNWWFGGFVRAQTVSGATFEDSPLVRSHSGIGGGLAVAWIFDRSSKLVPRWDR